MNRDIVLQKLRAAQDTLRAWGIVHLFLFGSTARNEATETSDIDVFFDRDPAVSMGLIELGRMQTAMGELVGAEVDLTTRGGLHPLIREDVISHAIRIF